MRSAVIASFLISFAAAQSGDIIGSAITGNGNGGVIVNGNTLTGSAASAAQNSIENRLSSEFASPTSGAPSVITTGLDGNGNGVVIVDGTTLTGSAAAAAHTSIENEVSSRISQAFGGGFGTTGMSTAGNSAAGQSARSTGATSSTSSGGAAHVTAVAGMGAIALGGVAAFML